MTNKIKLNKWRNSKSIYLIRQVSACVASGLIMLSAGMAFGFTGVMIPELERDDSIPYDRSYDSWVASIVPLASIFASLVAGPTIDKIGRKRGLMLIVFPVILGWLLLAFSKTVSQLLVGRFLTGIGTGATRPCALVYLGEIFDPKYRGTALFSLSLTMSVGILFCHVISNYMYWRICCFIFLLSPLAGLIILLFLNDSPIWFILKDRVDEGIEAFKWFRGDDEASGRELSEVILKQKGKAELTKKELLKYALTRSFLKPFVTVSVLFFAIQFLGLNNVSFYAKDMVKDTFSTDVDTFIMVIAIDSIRVISSCLICAVIDRLPRKLTFLSCSFLSSIFLFSVVLMLFLKTGLLWLLIICVVGYVFFGNAIISMSWSFLPEVFPGKVRGLASGIGSSVCFEMLFLSVNVTPRIRVSYGQEVVYIFYGTCTFVASVVLCFLLPETNGKTLQEIEDTYLSNKKIVSTKL